LKTRGRTGDGGRPFTFASRRSRPTHVLRATQPLGMLTDMSSAAAGKPRKRAARAVKAPVARQTTTSADKVAVVKGKSGKDPAAWRSAERAQFLIDTVGGVNKLAKTLGVSPSQPSRWKSGQEVPSPDIAAKLLDLDHVVALAMQTWHPVIVMDWMTTANGFLEGAQPIDVLLQRGSAEVIDALKATLSGAYA
jgi:uncharacterized protein (DUF2384 family)